MGEGRRELEGRWDWEQNQAGSRIMCGKDRGNGKVAMRINGDLQLMPVLR